MHKRKILDRGHLLEPEVAQLATIQPWSVTDELPELDGREPHALERFHRDLGALERRLGAIDASVQGRNPSLPPTMPTPATGHAPPWARRERAGDTPLHAERRAERERRARSLWWRTRASWINLYDLAWGFAAVALASAGYAVTLWGDTWGSTADLVSAFAVGFGAKLGVDQAQQFDWGSVPFFGRLFGEAPPGSGSAKTGGDDGGGDESAVKGNGKPKETTAAGQ
jgi:hypothetical protein